jgi:hypothetical protein
MVTLPMSRMPGMNHATSRKATRLARRYWSLTSSKISWLRRSRRKAWTARMPPMDSTKWTITSATFSRVTR